MATRKKSAGASSSAPPTRQHYVRVNDPSGLRLYVTNSALREIPLGLLQASVLSAAKKGTSGTLSSASGRKKFTVRVNFDRGEAHVQLAKER